MRRSIGRGIGYGLDDIVELSDEIIKRSDTATRTAIRKLTPGDYFGETSFDVPGGEVITLKTKVTVDNEAGEIIVDFEGSSPPSKAGINVVMAYTHAYAHTHTYAYAFGVVLVPFWYGLGVVWMWFGCICLCLCLCLCPWVCLCPCVCLYPYPYPYPNPVIPNRAFNRGTHP